ncbi:MAG: hypothetical protein E2O84_04880 [Bacteroidetes bacterium]|nr:MAG: hypothetical protein E2O84_04880 [Bacteroidota bacterium]
MKVADLEVRRLGRTEVKTKAPGLGGGHPGRRDRSDEEAVATVREAFDRGIDFVDTPPYFGLRERRVGLVLAGGWRKFIFRPG